MTVSEIEAYVLNEISKVAPKVDEEDVKNIIREYLEENPFEIPEATTEEKGVVQLANEVVSKDENVPTSDAVYTFMVDRLADHSNNESSHNDIRRLIDGLSTRLNTLANSDDETLDQMAELVEYIKSNRTLIEEVTTKKVSVTDIVNDLATNATDKPLSAAQGVALMNLISELNVAMRMTIKSGGTTGEPPVNSLLLESADGEYVVPYLTNRLLKPYILPLATETTQGAMSPDDKLKLDTLPNADEIADTIETALTEAKESGEFDGQAGQDGEDGVGIVSIEQTTTSTADDGNNIITVTLTNGQTVTFVVQNGSKGSTGTRGYGVIKITSSPEAATSSGASYWIGANNAHYTYRVSKSSVTSANGGNAPRKYDTVLYSYYLYPVEYVDSNYCYFNTRISIRGATGAPGADGEDGQDGYTPVKGVDYFDGQDGTSPTISVTAITGGHRISITDVNGTETVVVMDGADGSDGQDGADGNAGLSIYHIRSSSLSGKEGEYDISSLTNLGERTLQVGDIIVDSSANYYRVTQLYEGSDGPAANGFDAELLFSAKGEDGVPGSDGSDASVTAESIQNALGYTPADQSEVERQGEEIVVIHEDIDLVMENVDEKVDVSGITLDQHTDGLFYIFVNGQPKGNGLELKADVVEGDVVGVLDENNNIVLTGALADGTYTLTYEMADGSSAYVGTITIGEVVTYTITQNLTNVSSNNSATEIQSGESFTAILTASDGYELSTVTVTMGGVDITSSAVSGGTINIANVTGDVVITAVAEKAVVEIKNWIANSQNADGSLFSDTGYKANTRLGTSDGGERTQSGIECTGFIPVTINDTLYFKGVTITTATSETTCWYDSDHNFISGGGSATNTVFGTMDGSLKSIKISDIKTGAPANNGSEIAYVRISASEINANSIITKNQPIE